MSCDISKSNSSDYELYSNTVSEDEEEWAVGDDDTLTLVRPQPGKDLRYITHQQLRYNYSNSRDRFVLLR